MCCWQTLLQNPREEGLLPPPPPPHPPPQHPVPQGAGGGNGALPQPGAGGQVPAEGNGSDEEAGAYDPNNPRLAKCAHFVRGMNAVYPELNETITTVLDFVGSSEVAGSQITLNHQQQSLSEIPPLTKDCFAALSSAPTSSWKREVPWKRSFSQVQASGADVDQAGPAAAPQTKQIKLAQNVHDGLSRLADRLGYVWGDRAQGKQGLPNVKALLHALGTGEAFAKESVLARSMGHLLSEHVSALEQQVTRLHTAVQIFRNDYVPFSATFNRYLIHTENQDVTRNPTWPKQREFTNAVIGPAQPLTLPPNITAVYPEALQEKIAKTIRRRMMPYTQAVAEEFCSAYGFDDPYEQGCEAIAWQFGAQKRSREMPFSAAGFVQACVKCPPLKAQFVNAATTTPDVQRQIYRRGYPDARQEQFMMASTGTTYRSRIGYKKLCPRGAWHGPAKAVQTKHAIFDHIKNTVPVRPSADGWFVSIRSVLELELESLLVQKLWQPVKKERDKETIGTACTLPCVCVCVRVHACVCVRERVSE